MRRLRGQCEDTSMKAFAIMPAVAAAILSFNISTASSQAACEKEYQACMDGCTGRSAKSLQDSCFTSCQGRNDLCAERVYGKRQFNIAPSSVAVQKPQAKDALAKDAPVNDTPAKTEKQPAVVPEPQAPAR
jgi:hypothetical protein